MKTCGYCQSQYGDHEPKCPVCGSTILKHSQGANAAADEYKRIKDEIAQKRKKRSQIIGIITAVAVLAIVVVIASVIGHVNDPQRDIDAAAKEQYEAAVQDVRAGNYDAALSTLDAIDPSWSDYYKTESTRMEAVRGILMNRAEGYMASGDYKSLIVLINSNVENINSDAEIKSIYENAANNYRSQVLAEAENAYNSNGYEAALSVINVGLSVLPGDAMLSSEKDMYAACAPVDLASLTPYFEGTIDVFTDGATDTMGNTYRTGMRGYMSTSDASHFDCYNIWDIGCRYNTLTATGIILDVDKGSKNEGSFRIYGDGVLLYEKTGIGSTTKPYSIEIDITGVTDLKIEMYGDGNLYSGGIDSVLVDVMLHKNK